MNAVVAAVAVMLVLSLLRIHVVVALIIGALTGGLIGGMSLEATIEAFNSGLGGGATVALSYATLARLPSPLANPAWPTPWRTVRWR